MLRALSSVVLQLDFGRKVGERELSRKGLASDVLFGCFAEQQLVETKVVHRRSSL